MKNWFITGTSSGLGKILTEKLLKQGNRVAATVRKADALDDLKAQFGDQLRVYVLDVTDGAAIKETVNAAFADLGHIDVVVNNAGYALFCAIEEAADEQIEHQLSTNILGLIRVTRAFLPHLRKQGGGRILQVSSAGGQTTYPNFGFYHTTKWAIEGFSDTLAKEVAPLNIQVTIVEPGAHATSFGTAMVTAPAMEAYNETPAGDVRRAIAANTFPLTGDVNVTVQAMIDCAEQTVAPRRLALGKDAYWDVRADLEKRLAELDAQKELALSSDVSLGTH